MNNFKKALVGAALVAATTLGASAANAAVTLVSFASYQSALNANESLVANFGAGPLTESPWTLTGGVIMNGDSGDGAAPAFGPGADDATNYLSVRTGETATISTTDTGVKHISFYVGSLDTYNYITFHTAGGSQTFSGTDLGLKSGAANGNQTAANTNGRFTFYSSDLITSVDLYSGSNSFEVSNIGAAVPEPATWAMMIIGFGAVGGMARSARRRGTMAFA